MNLRNTACLSGSLLLVFLLSRVGYGQQATDRKPPRDEYRPRRLLRPHPPITHFQLKSADEIGNTLNPAELVVGVTVGDESRAYPLNMLSGPHREIINDTLGERPIAATW